jgi:hypothetical protein
MRALRLLKLGQVLPYRAVLPGRDAPRDGPKAAPMPERPGTDPGKSPARSLAADPESTAALRAVLDAEGPAPLDQVRRNRRTASDSRADSHGALLFGHEPRSQSACAVSVDALPTGPGSREEAAQRHRAVLLAGARLGAGPSSGRQLSRRGEARLDSDPFVQRLARLD